MPTRALSAAEVSTENATSSVALRWSRFIRLWDAARRAAQGRTG